VTTARTGLTALHDVGDLVAAKILGHIGSIDRFRSEAAFASYCAVAPIEVSSGGVQRHRLSRAGDRQLNYTLHVIAIAQIRGNTVGRVYYQRKRAAGKGHKEALRCLKRRLATVVYRVMIHAPIAGSPDGRAAGVKADARPRVTTPRTSSTSISS